MSNYMKFFVYVMSAMVWAFGVGFLAGMPNARDRHDVDDGVPMCRMPDYCVCEVRQ